MNKSKKKLFFILTISLNNNFIAMEVTKNKQLPILPPEILITIFEHLVNQHFNNKKNCLFCFYEKLNERKNLKSDLVNLRLINKNCKNLIDQYLIKNTIKLKQKIYNNFTNQIISKNKLNSTQLNLKLSIVLNQNKYTYKELKLGIISIICGADPDFKGKLDKTLLIILAQYGYVGLLHILLETKANIDLQNIYGNTALIESLKHQHKNIAKLLINRNANINLIGKNGITALILSCKKGYQDIVKLLLIKGANTTIKDKNGYTALDWAIKNRNKNLIKLLTKKPLTCFRQ